jgi:hypothetical protein
MHRFAVDGTLLQQVYSTNKSRTDKEDVLVVARSHSKDMFSTLTLLPLPHAQSDRDLRYDV